MILDGQGCITNFENTAEFSHEYQSEQECMCDREHMFACPEENNAGEYGRNYGDRYVRTDSSLNHFQIDEHKNLVAKKFHVKKVCIIFYDNFMYDQNFAGLNLKQRKYLFRARIPI